MATTTNYSWTTPDDTDLVKDGASAIRTLGSAIDTTVFTNAGAAVPKSVIDAEGDLIVGDAADAVQRLAIGSNGNVLTVDTSLDGKIKWAAPASSGFVGWYLYNSAVQSLANNTATNITMDSEFYDTDAFHTSSDAIITIPAGKAGKYLLVGAITYGTNSSGQRYANFNINSNGATNPQLVFQTTSSGIASTLIVNVWDLAENDTVALQGQQTSGGNLNVVVQNKDLTYFSGAKIG
jgi:hypothetical protein